MTPDTPPHATPGAVPLDGTRFAGDPAALYRRLRDRHGPVVPVTLTGGRPAWLVIGYREAHHVAGHPEIFARDPGTAGHGGPPSLAALDGDAHERRAGALGDALEATEPLGLRRAAERAADALVDTFCARGRADLTADFAEPLTARVLTGLCGFPDAEAHLVAAALGAPPDEGGEGDEGSTARADLTAAVAALVTRRRATAPPPGSGDGRGPDLVSRLLADPRALTDEEVTRDTTALLTTGHRPTADWIGSTLRLMLTDDRFSAPVSGGRHNAGDALHEVLWDDTPTQNAPGRRATRATQLGGRSIAAGDLLVLGLQGANGDPEIRRAAGADAEAAFWVTGLTGISTAGNRAYLSFGHGTHRCPFPAQEIAETVARTGVEVLLDRLPDIAPDTQGGAPSRRPSPWRRGLAALPVRFQPTAERGAGGR
ncbi:cytochrome P450 [Streptomyces avicenniae]|uniref:cytochrome P450 n=1 Tax=Streptomyces avicenniae TaxID=500153 RepID=UPI00069B839C|nr:cytochrome P450 [Streptomyces avicenniae]